MPTDEHYWQFGIVTACVCIPFFILIGSLNTTRGLHFWRHKVVTVGKIFFSWISRSRRTKSLVDTDGLDHEDDEKRCDSPLSTRPTARPIPSTRYARNQAAKIAVTNEQSRATSELRRPGVERRPSLTAQPSSHIANMIAGEVERRRTVTYGPEV